MKASDLLQLRDEFTHILSTQKLKMEAKMRINLKLQKLKTFADVYSEDYEALIKKYGTVAENGMPEVKPSSPNWAAFLDEIKKLGEEEIEDMKESDFRMTYRQLIKFDEGSTGNYPVLFSLVEDIPDEEV